MKLLINILCFVIFKFVNTLEKLDTLEKIIYHGMIFLYNLERIMHSSVYKIRSKYL